MLGNPIILIIANNHHYDQLSGMWTIEIIRLFIRTREILFYYNEAK